MLRRVTVGGTTAAVLAIACAAATALAGPLAQAATSPARTSLPAIEQRVMCVTCKIPLMVADSPQADRERAYIRSLIAQGLTEPQIERAMVSQYGPSVLGLPGAHGFDLTAYLVPAAALLALVATLMLLLPRWRRRSRSPLAAGAPPLAPRDAARLDADLARFDR